MSSRLDPDQARLFVGPDLGPNCSRMLVGKKLKKKTIAVFIEGATDCV